MPKKEKQPKKPHPQKPGNPPKRTSDDIPEPEPNPGDGA